MTPEAIAVWLTRNPDFFEKHPDILTELQVPAPRQEGTIPLIEKQVRVLKDKTRQLNAAMAQLMAYGESNDQIVAATHRLALHLMRATSVETVMAAVRASMDDDFAVTGWQLGLWHPQAAGHGLSRKPLPMSARALESPVVGHYLPPEMMAWLPQTADAWQSFALAALKNPAGEAFGALILASESEHRFSPDMETRLLADIAELIAAAFERVLAA